MASTEFLRDTLYPTESSQAGQGQHGTISSDSLLESKSMRGIGRTGRMFEERKNKHQEEFCFYHSAVAKRSINQGQRIYVR